MTRILISFFFVVQIAFCPSLIHANELQPNSSTIVQNVDIININSASVEELVKLKGIGLKKAEAIVNYRNKNGAFKSLDDLLNIKGVGVKIISDNKTLLTL